MSEKNDLVINVKSTVDDASFQASGQKVRQHAKGMEHGGIHKQLEDLNKAIGKGSTFGHLVHAAEGAGAVGGLALAAHLLSDMTKEASELRKQFHEGAIDASGLAVGIGKSIPFIGQFVSLGQEIRDLFTHEREELEQTNAEAKAANNLAEYRLKVLRESREVNRSIVDDIRKTQHEGNTVGLLGSAKTISDLRFGHEEFIHQQNEELRKSREKMEQEAQAKKKETYDALIEGGLTQENAQKKAEEAAQQLRNDRKGILDKEAANRDADIKAHGITTSRKINAATDDAIEAEMAKQKEERNQLAAQRGEVGLQQAARFGYAQKFQHHQIDDDTKRNIENAVEEYQKRLSDIDRSGGASPEFKEKLQDDLSERVSLLKEEGQLKKLDADDNARLSYEQTLTHLRKEQLTDLDAQIASGNKAAIIERQRLEIQEQYAQRRKELEEEMRTADARLRPSIQAAIDALPGQEAAAQSGRTGQSFIDIAKSIAGQLSGGSPILQKRLRQSEANQQFTDQRSQLEAILNDPNATPDQKDAARQALAMMPDIQKNAIAQIGRQGIQFTGTATGIHNQGRISGFGMAAREQAFLQSHSSETDPVKQGQEMIRLLEKIEAALRNKNMFDSQNNQKRPPARVLN